MAAKSLGEVLILFLTPFGGGIPAGVLLAKTRMIPWPVTTILYFISDIVLACVFEPLMLQFIKMSKDSPKLTRMAESYKASLIKSGVKFGTALSPYALVMISFGVDPMTGRAAAKAAGHGFFSGWAIAICGDMFFFGIIMVSTLWLSEILGDGTIAVVAIVILMVVVPMLVRRIKKRFFAPKINSPDVS